MFVIKLVSPVLRDFITFCESSHILTSQFSSFFETVLDYLSLGIGISLVCTCTITELAERSSSADWPVPLWWSLSLLQTVNASVGTVQSGLVTCWLWYELRFNLSLTAERSDGVGRVQRYKLLVVADTHCTAIYDHFACVVEPSATT